MQVLAIRVIKSVPQHYACMSVLTQTNARTTACIGTSFAAVKCTRRAKRRQPVLFVKSKFAVANTFNSSQNLH